MGASKYYISVFFYFFVGGGVFGKFEYIFFLFSLWIIFIFLYIYSMVVEGGGTPSGILSTKLPIN